MKTASFDESVELHLVVEEQGLKGEVELPHSTGKTVRVAIVDDKVLAAIEAGKIDFDVLITHPSYMPKLAKFAKVLGPKGLMPNPKAGTISPNPEEVAKKFQKGVLRWKTEPKATLIHQMLGKISMKEEEIKENIEAFFKSVGTKNIKKAYLKTTMSPSVKIEVGV
jgi:large subunit ribosomal protein L1